MDKTRDHITGTQVPSIPGDNNEEAPIRSKIPNEVNAPSSSIQTTHHSKSLDEQILPEQPVESILGINPVNNRNSDFEEGAGKNKRKSRLRCRFYGTKNGCRAGDNCSYSHADPPRHKAETQAKDVSSATPSTRDNAIPKVEKSPVSSQTQIHVTNSKHQNASASRGVTSKPKPRQENARDFEINQVVRRFAPIRKDVGDDTILSFGLKPSDPDFPFELEHLECSLSIPTSYPQNGRPSIRISNKEMERGYQINIERGFDNLAAQSPPKSLLSLLNELDKRLEEFLTNEKAQTIKIVTHANRKPPPSTSSREASHVTKSEPQSTIQVQSAPTFTSNEKENAKTKRETDIRQLEARMSQVPLFQTSSNGTTFNVPLQVSKPAKLPVNLQSIKEVTLIVPPSYNLEPCTIKLKGVEGVEVRHVEKAFEIHASQHLNLTLMAHINHLSQNLYQMGAETAVEPSEKPVNPKDLGVPLITAPTKPNIKEEKSKDTNTIEDRPHLQFIPRPPEWDMHQNTVDSESESSDSVDSDDEYEDTDEEQDEGGAAIPETAVSTGISEKGILLSFPELELYGIELLQISSLSVTLKCDRCKADIDIKNIKPTSSNETVSFRRTESCNKCATYISVTYRSELMHTNSIKAGYLDLEGSSTVIDMLPSTFIPTCSECSTSSSSQGIISVRGETSFTNCRNCHQKMTFKIREVKFLRISPNASRNLPLPPRKKKENLGITVGQELPSRGKCSHYRRSYRWFRFNCCQKVFPCDKCHDEKVEGKNHKSEFANRMICGWCSREQNYRPEDCGICGKDLIGRKGTGGFWEGGKGTRDKVKMNRKDPRKYKRN